ncbi:MAG: hypothetical protein IJE04_02360 [Bacilli bacterium]|nr:hypothetical protein [Bacilli bacterium]
MNKIDDLFKYNQIISNEIERKIIVALFELLYSKQQITKSELDSLVLNTCRTFNLN